MKASVLVVDDEAGVRAALTGVLEDEGYEVEAVASGEACLEAPARRAYDAILLDVWLPGLDGLSLCRAVRNGRLNHDVPILMLTARREESDKVVGLEAGADDYLTKPFGVRELVARVRALLRRPRQALPLPASADAARIDGDLVRVGGVEIDVPRRRVQVDGRPVTLTDQEFRLLHLLATHAGIVFSREALVARVWKGDTHVTERSVDTLVKRLRRKIERDPAAPDYLLTVWGTGYKAADG